MCASIRGTNSRRPVDTSVQVQDSSAENRRLADVLRELGRLLPGGSEVDWQELRGRCGEVLGELIRRSEESRRLTVLLESAPYFVGGDEHHVIRVSSDTRCVRLVLRRKLMQPLCKSGTPV